MDSFGCCVCSEIKTEKKGYTEELGWYPNFKNRPGDVSRKKKSLFWSANYQQFIIILKQAQDRDRKGRIPKPAQTLSQRLLHHCFPVQPHHPHPEETHSKHWCYFEGFTDLFLWSRVRIHFLLSLSSLWQLTVITFTKNVKVIFLRLH